MNSVIICLINKDFVLVTCAVFLNIYHKAVFNAYQDTLRRSYEV